MGQELTPYKAPSQNCSIAQQAMTSKELLRWSTSPREAIKQAEKLIAGWPSAKAGNPLGYAISIAATLEQYPLGIVRECCDVRTGLAREREFLPTPHSVIEFCNRRMKFHRGAVIWGEQEAARQADRERFSEEHERGMLARLQKLLHGFFDSKPQPQESK